MIRKRFDCCMTILLLVVAGLSHATKAGDKTQPGEPVPEVAQAVETLMPLYANRMFSGVVTSEAGERYGYYFRIQRDMTRFRMTAILVLARNNKVVLYEDQFATMEEGDKTVWRVGRAFMRYYPVNDSWIFGVKPQGGTGFNFRVEMQSASGLSPVTREVYRGVALQINQTSLVNGHIRFADREEFVTGTNAWFRQVSVREQAPLNHTLSGLFCRFPDGAGFYALRLPEKSALHGALAGWLDARGKPLDMSQFVQVNKGQDGAWKVTVPFPKRHFMFVNALFPPPESGLVQSPEVVAGFSDEGKNACFCTYSDDWLGGQKLLPVLAKNEQTRAVG